MYKEDCDLDYRLFLAGWLSRQIPEAIIYHDRTAAGVGRNYLARMLNRRQKSRQVRSWSFLNQHLIFVKHWNKQNLANKLKIIFRGLLFFIFSLILEQYNLKNYPLIFGVKKVLTNVK
jgi:GT2 family glycosyltransferase